MLRKTVVSTLLVSLATSAACTSSAKSTPWLVFLRGERATLSLDTTRVDTIPFGYRVHVRAQFSEPAYRPTRDGPAYDRAVMTLEVDCRLRHARSIEATILDSQERPAYHETYSALWREFAQHELGPEVLDALCRVIPGARTTINA